MLVVTSLAGFVTAHPRSHWCHVQSFAATLSPLVEEPSRGHSQHCPGCPQTPRSGPECPELPQGCCRVLQPQSPSGGRSRIPAPNKALLCSCQEGREGFLLPCSGGCFPPSLARPDLQDFSKPLGVLLFTQLRVFFHPAESLLPSQSPSARPKNKAEFSRCFSGFLALFNIFIMYLLFTFTCQYLLTVLTRSSLL